MKKERLAKLNYYRYLLIEYKKIQIYNQLTNEIDAKIPYKGKPKQKILTLNR